jgi:Ca-activated chloride channel family protein
MQQLFLMGRILPIGARLMVRHTFQCESARPLELIYTFPLPRDAALRKFRVSGKGFSIQSQLKPVSEAMKMYEQGIEGGHLSTLARQYPDGLTSLMLGNIRPGEQVTVNLEILAGVEIHDDGIRFRFPFTLSPSYHPKAKAVTIDAAAGEIELPEEEFGDLILPQFRTDDTSLHQVGFGLSVRLSQAFKEISSPSHTLRTGWSSQQEVRVSLGQEADVPNRDLVLEVRTQEPFSGVVGGVAKDGKKHFAMIVPSTQFGLPEVAHPRRIVFVLDRSGSMQGRPIEQATKAVEACLGALSEADTFGLVAFDDEVGAFKPALLSATKQHRRAAADFLNQIRARGGTQLARGVLKAAELLGNEGGDALIVTDGQVFGTQSILQQARTSGIRIHCLGIGSASQDRFLTLLARGTGGVSRFLTPGERVDLSAVDLFASIGHPVAQQLRAETAHLPETAILPEPSTFVFAGNPLVVFGETGAREGKLLLTWQNDLQTKTLECPVRFGENRLGDTVRLLRGARLITDLESRLEGSEKQSGMLRRTEDRITKRLESLSQTFGLASRGMALVAVIERQSDRPGELPQTQVVPVGMPQDVSFDAYFGPLRFSEILSLVKSSSAQFELNRLGDSDSVALEIAEVAPKWMKSRRRTSAQREIEDPHFNLACQMEADGGMPGKDPEVRILSTLLALLSFVEKGHTSQSGAFRLHVQRLISFLQSDSTRLLSSEHKMLANKVIELAQKGQSLSGNWGQLAREPLAESTIPQLWDKIGSALQSIAKISDW